MAFAIVTACLAPLAYVAMFTGFRGYDDEGYFLLTLRDYVSGQPLFKQALPVYGPFYYEVVGAPFKLLGASPGHDGGRWLTVAVWILASLLGGLAALKLSRNTLIGLGAMLVTFRALYALVNEPPQPAGLIAVLLLGLVLASAYRESRPRLTAAIIGAFVAAMLLIKINVGIIAAIPVAFAWSAGLAPQLRRLVWPAVALLASAAPLVLMARFLNEAWVLELALLVGLSAAGVGVVSLRTAPPRMPAQATGWIVGGGLALALASIGIAVGGGARLSDMWNGLVVLAFRFPEVFAVPLNISPAADIWAVVAVGLAFAPFHLSNSGQGVARILAAVCIWLGVLLLPTPAYLYALPLVWLAVRPPSSVDAGSVGAYARAFAPMLAVAATMQIFPVAGTQLSLGSLPLILVGAIILSDGIRQSESLGISRAAGPISFALPALATALLAPVAVLNFAGATPLGLPGAQSMRVSSDQASQLRGLVAAIDRRCQGFVSIPAMGSLYVWTAQDPPPELSSELWWLVLDKPSQQSIASELEGRNGLCVVRNQRSIDFWARGRPVPDGPLVEFINQDFESIGQWGDYQLLVRIPNTS